MKNEEEFSLVLQQNCDWCLFKNKTFLISGATGLIGTAIVDLLCYLNTKRSLNIKLILLSRSIQPRDYATDYITALQHDINEPLCDVITKPVDFIINLASNTHPELYASKPIETITTNVMGTYNLLKIAEKSPKCRFLFASSVEIYGNDTKNLEGGFSESDFGYLDSNTLRAGYPESKRVCESLCQAFKAEKNVEICIARLARCYGPALRSDDTKVLSQFLKDAKAHKNIVLKSEGRQRFSYLYSADAACAILFLLLNGSNGEAYNVAGKNSSITIYELAQMIAELSDTKIENGMPKTLEKLGFSTVEVAVLNTNKINQLGWESKISLKDGLLRTLGMRK